MNANDTQTPVPPSAFATEKEAAVRVQRLVGQFRWECLCQKCWTQFELPGEHAEHICPSCHENSNLPLISEIPADDNKDDDV